MCSARDYSPTIRRQYQLEKRLLISEFVTKRFDRALIICKLEPFQPNTMVTPCFGMTTY